MPMPNVTLVMTRQPLAEFLWMRGRDAHYEEIEDEAERTTLLGAKNDKGHRTDRTGRSRGLLSGQWGTMAVVEGPLVLSASRAPTVRDTIDALGTMAETPGTQGGKLTQETVTLAGQQITVYATGGKITRVTEFDTMERYRTDSDKNKWYVRLPAQPLKAYPVVMFHSSTVEAFHRKLGIRRRHPGMCLRVLDHPVKQPGTNNMAGILLHEATNLGWLTGCIAPRTKGHRALSADVAPCIEALDTIYGAMGGFSTGRRAGLIIID
jgi:hypothetical protein